MFKKNSSHIQPELFGYESQDSSEILKMIEKTEEYAFYKLIFSQINERIFSPLYSDTGRPNAAVNVMVSALILKEKRNWSYTELLKQLQFNLAVRAAVGLFNIGSSPFSEATIFNFQTRLNRYMEQTGKNLLETVFSGLTKMQLKKLKLKTGIARTDSFMIETNIRQYSRLQLLLEVVLRLYRVLKKKDQLRFFSLFSVYTKQSSDHYIYRLKGTDLPHEFEKLTAVYVWIRKNLSEVYHEKEEYRTYDRVCREHFSFSEKSDLTLRPVSELPSNTLQSPDDPEATYRVKRSKKYHGYSGNIVETCDPSNSVNLIADVSVHPNNIDDSTILTERMDAIQEKLPDLEELHADGGYGSTANDQRFENDNIEFIQTGIRGRKAAVEMEIEETAPECYVVTCPNGQSVHAERTRKRNKAVFQESVCCLCQYRKTCPSIKQKFGRVFYFDLDYYMRKQRHHRHQKLPDEKKKLRPNVEATVKEFTRNTDDHKLKVRGFFKTGLFVLLSAIGINFGRIYRYLRDNPSSLSYLCCLTVQIKKNLTIFALRKWISNVIFLLQQKLNYYEIQISF